MIKRSGIWACAYFAIGINFAEAQNIYTWKQGDKPLKLESTATSVCLMTSISGPFQANDTFVSLDTFQDIWTLQGNPQTSNLEESNVAISATCFPLAKFHSGEAAEVKWSSKSFSVSAGEQTNHSGSCQIKELPTWDRDAATFLSGIGGNDAAQALNSPGTVTSQSSLKVFSCYKSTSAKAISFFVGKPHIGHVAQWYQYAGDERTSVPNGDYDPRLVPHDVVNGGIFMAHVEKGACGFVGISGRFNNAYDRVSITQAQADDGMRWKLTEKAGKNNSIGPHAVARCFAFDQTPDPARANLKGLQPKQNQVDEGSAKHGVKEP